MPKLQGHHDLYNDSKQGCEGLLAPHMMHYINFVDLM